MKPSTVKVVDDFDMNQKTSPDLDEWVSKFNKDKAVPKSKTLEYPIEVREAIKQFLEMKVSGKTLIPLSKFREEFLGKKFGYTLSDHSLKRYMRRYEPELWEQLKNGK